MLKSMFCLPAVKGVTAGTPVDAGVVSLLVASVPACGAARLAGASFVSVPGTELGLPALLEPATDCAFCLSSRNEERVICNGRVSFDSFCFDFSVICYNFRVDWEILRRVRFLI